MLGALVRRPFDVLAPFNWKTKADVVGLFGATGHPDLIRHTRSCSKVRDQTRLHTHCGCRSQCLDRRFGVLAAGLADHDPAEAYATELFLGERPPGPEREMALAFVRHASAIKDMSDMAFFARFPEANRAVEQFDEPARVIAERIFDLHVRHSEGVCAAFDEATRRLAPQLRSGALPETSLMRLVDGAGASVKVEVPAEPVERPSAGLGSPVRQLVLDPSGETVTIEGWGRIAGVGAALLNALAETHLAAAAEGTAVKDHPFVTARALSEVTCCTSDEALRRRVMNLRRAIAKRAKAAGDNPPSDDHIIENVPWHGYRLNPDRVRVIRPVTTKSGRKVTSFAKKVTSRSRTRGESGA